MLFIITVSVPPLPKSVVWYNCCGRVDVGERYTFTEDSKSGMYMIEAKPTEACDGGTWKCVVTNDTGAMVITACVVDMEGMTLVEEARM